MPYIFHCNAQFATGWQRRSVTSKNSLSSFAFKTSRASLFLSQDEFVSIPSVASFRRMHFRRIDFYEWFSIYLRRSSTRRCTAQGSVLNRRSPPTSALGERRPMFVAHPPRLCHLHFASSRFRPNSFDVRRVKLLLQTQPDVYYGCLNGKFFCVPYSLISTIAIIRGEACDADINNRVPSFDRVASVEIYTLHSTKDDRSSKSVSFVRCRRLILSGRGKKSMQLFCRCSLQRK